MVPQAPVDCLLSRLDGVRGRPPKVRATCPACGRRGALSVGEGREHNVLVRCFAGCQLRDIADAVAMRVVDLFPARDPDAIRQRDAMRQSYRATPRAAISRAISAEIARTRERLHKELGYHRPLRAADFNAARLRVSQIFGMPPPVAIEPFDWEGAPWDDDPCWPTLYRRAAEEETRRRWHGLHPEAEGWETDPDGPGIYDRLRAEHLARVWLRALSGATV